MSPILHAAFARVLDTPNSWGNYNFGSSKKIRAIYCLRVPRSEVPFFGASWRCVSPPSALACLLQP